MVLAFPLFVFTETELEGIVLDDVVEMMVPVFVVFTEPELEVVVLVLLLLLLPLLLLLLLVLVLVLVLVLMLVLMPVLALVLVLVLAPTAVIPALMTRGLYI